MNRKILKKYLMECNHVVVVLKGKTPICTRCNCSKAISLIKSVTDGLEGRYAKSKNKIVRSRWDLPGFVYQPDEEFDIYLYGR